MKVVVNTTPIISLAAISHLHLLEKLFGKIIIAEVGLSGNKILLNNDWRTLQ